MKTSLLLSILPFILLATAAPVPNSLEAESADLVKRELDFELLSRSPGEMDPSVDIHARAVLDDIEERDFVVELETRGRLNRPPPKGGVRGGGPRGSQGSDEDMKLVVLPNGHIINAAPILPK